MIDLNIKPYSILFGITAIAAKHLVDKEPNIGFGEIIKDNYFVGNDKGFFVGIITNKRVVFDKLSQQLTWSKHKDQTIEKVISNNIDWINWALKTVQGFKLEGEVLDFYNSIEPDDIFENKEDLPF